MMKYDTLRAFLTHDPTNLSLLADAAEAALREGRLAECRAHLDAYRSCAPENADDNSALLNLDGLLALEARDYAWAAECFAAALRAQDNPGVRFNFAWAKAMQGEFAVVADALQDDAALAAPRGPGLKVRALHHLGRLEEALETGTRLYALRPNDHDLAGALALAALDADRPDLAMAFARDGDDSPDALSTRGALALDAGDTAGALETFERVLSRNANDPRALAGKGLCLLGTDSSEAAACLDRSAEIFGRHAGAWIAAAWAHFIRQDFLVSRMQFERAVALDGSFSEGHGGLAVLDFVAGDLAGAQKHADVATRLDRHSFAGALAKMLLLNASGDQAAAARIRDAALTTPIGPGGKTIAQAMAQFSLRRPAPP